MEREITGNSPRLPTDFEDDGNLATHKLSQLHFKRPHTPANLTRAAEPYTGEENDMG